MLKTKQAFTKEQIETMGVELLKQFTDSGGTIVTNKEGVEKLKELDREAEYRKYLEEVKIKMETMRIPDVKKPKHKYPSNFTVSPKRHRKPKTKY